ncbi:hypothetical protein Pyn_08089 [Prunus yedoensis var. nudiflora]|uniref:Uncharacterized protein n=1 Tax=Prunus yedoensis var. nudiflora TaxID=2094558 RepID=A0A314XYF7_PRUYE|nr:hypothetical protein Pyn_08089 [Prunus yedoensis var. nudiflora]
MQKTPFEGAYGLKPQNVLDLVPLPEEMKMSDDGEDLADQVKRVHEEVRSVIKARMSHQQPLPINTKESKILKKETWFGCI